MELLCVTENFLKIAQKKNPLFEGPHHLVQSVYSVFEIMRKVRNHVQTILRSRQCLLCAKSTKQGLMSYSLRRNRKLKYAAPPKDIKHVCCQHVFISLSEESFKV